MRLSLKHFAVLCVIFTLLLTALALAAVSAYLFHVQIRRQATRLTRYIEAAADPAVLGPPTGPPELSGASVAAEKLGQALEKSRDEREAAARRLGPLTDALRVGVILCHPDKKLEFANRRVFELSGTNGFEEFREGWNLVEGPVRDVMQSLDATPQSQGATIEVIMGNPLRHLRLQVYRIGPEAGEGYVALMTDPEVTALLEENVFLASQMQSLSRVYRTVVHELRSPLGAMIVNLDLLRESLSARAIGRATVRQDQDCARTFIEQYGGTIRAESGKGRGTCFEISLPVAAAGPRV